MPKEKSSGGRKSHGRGPALASGPERDGCRLAGRIWLQHGDETILAWGRVVLLERIRDLGSINAAAKSMGMGFRHAWLLVDEMNRLCPAPLVTRATGGKGGGGTKLTPHGEKAIESFWKLAESFSSWLDKQDPVLWGPLSPGGARGKAKGTRVSKPVEPQPKTAKPAINAFSRRVKPKPGGKPRGRPRKADPGWSFP